MIYKKYFFILIISIFYHSLFCMHENSSHFGEYDVSSTSTQSNSSSSSTEEESYDTEIISSYRFFYRASLNIPKIFKIGTLDRLILINKIKKYGTIPLYENLKNIPRPNLILYTKEPEALDYTTMYHTGIPLCLTIQVSFHPKMSKKTKLITTLLQYIQNIKEKTPQAYEHVQITNKKIDNGTFISTIVDKHYEPISIVECTTYFYDRYTIEAILKAAEQRKNKKENL